MYRLLNVNDGHEYAALVHDAYQADGELGIDFAAVTLPEEKLIRGLILNPTYGLFIEGRLVSAITLRMPWVKKPGPYGVPHLGWVSTRPEEKGVRIFFWTILVVLTLSLSFLCILLDSCRPR